MPDETEEPTIAEDASEEAEVRSGLNSLVILYQGVAVLCVTPLEVTDRMAVSDPPRTWFQQLGHTRKLCCAVRDSRSR